MVVFMNMRIVQGEGLESFLVLFCPCGKADPTYSTRYQRNSGILCIYVYYSWGKAHGPVNYVMI